jgi:Fe-S-cluster containining protein
VLAPSRPERYNGTVPAPPSIALDAAASAEANAHLTRMLHALQDALRAPADDVEALERGLHRAFDAYDAFVAHVVAAHPMRCAAGCTACCHDNPRGVTGVELERLAAVIDGWADAAAIYAAFAELARQREHPDAWRRARRPCPLLRDGRCRAYAERPLACRAFFALTPPEWCDPAHASYSERVNPHLDPPRILLQILQALSARRGLPTSIDLHTGLARG